jgi:hypothetical protein
MTGLRFLLSAACISAFSLAARAEPVPGRPARLPVPDAAAQAKVLAQMKEIWRAEYAKTAPEEKQSLAVMLLAEGVKVTDDPDSLHGMLNQARLLAAAAGDPATAVRAGDALAARFDVDRFKLAHEALTTCSGSARTKESHALVAEEALRAAEAALEAECPDDAGRLAALAGTEAGRSQIAQQSAGARALAQSAQVLKAELLDVKPALQTLAGKPDDPAACAVVGRYRCFTRGEWDQGLPLLAKGGDPLLKAAAEADATAPEDATGQAAVGDAWWAAAQKLAGAAKAGAAARADHWYARALPALQGISRLRLEKKIKEVAAALPAAPSAKPKRWDPALVRPLLPDDPDKGLVTRLVGRQFPVGDVEWLDASGKPVGWVLKPGITLETGGANHFIRIAQQDKSDPAKAWCGTNLMAEVPAEWTSVRVAVRIRVTGLKTLDPGPESGVRIGVWQLREKDSLRSAERLAVEILKKDMPWTEKTLDVRMAGETRVMQLWFNVAQSVGTMDVDDVRVLPGP